MMTHTRKWGTSLMDSACSGEHRLPGKDLTNKWHSLTAHNAQSYFLPFFFTAATSPKSFCISNFILKSDSQKNQPVAVGVKSILRKMVLRWNVVRTSSIII